MYFNRCLRSWAHIPQISANLRKHHYADSSVKLYLHIGFVALWLCHGQIFSSSAVLPLPLPSFYQTAPQVESASFLVFLQLLSLFAWRHRGSQPPSSLQYSSSAFLPASSSSEVAQSVLPMVDILSFTSGTFMFVFFRPEKFMWLNFPAKLFSSFTFAFWCASMLPCQLYYCRSNGLEESSDYWPLTVLLVVC